MTRVISLVTIQFTDAMNLKGSLPLFQYRTLSMQRNKNISYLTNCVKAIFSIAAYNTQ